MSRTECMFRDLKTLHSQSRKYPFLESVSSSKAQGNKRQEIERILPAESFRESG